MKKEGPDAIVQPDIRNRRSIISKRRARLQVEIGNKEKSR